MALWHSIATTITAGILLWNNAKTRWRLIFASRTTRFFFLHLESGHTWWFSILAPGAASFTLLLLFKLVDNWCCETISSQWVIRWNLTPTSVSIRQRRRLNNILKSCLRLIAQVNLLLLCMLMVMMDRRLLNECKSFLLHQSWSLFHWATLRLKIGPRPIRLQNSRHKLLLLQWHLSWLIRPLGSLSKQLLQLLNLPLAILDLFHSLLDNVCDFRLSYLGLLRHLRLVLAVRYRWRH